MSIGFQFTLDHHPNRLIKSHDNSSGENQARSWSDKDVSNNCVVSCLNVHVSSDFSSKNLSSPEGNELVSLTINTQEFIGP